MQIIIVSRHLKSARTLTIMPRHLVAAAALFVTLVLATTAFLTWVSLYVRLPLIDDLLVAVQQRETQQTREYVSNNLQLMATRLGELQGRVLQLDTLGERMSELTGVQFRKAVKPAEGPGQGGPFLPDSLSAGELQQEIDRLSALVDQQADELSFMEFRLLEQRVQERLLPTVIPVASGTLGSGFGVRADPFAGVRARHDGLDFSAPPGTAVIAAADGVVVAAEYHPEFGNVIDIDHGDGLSSRYAHLSAMNSQVGTIVRRGERIGSVGSTGRSTGPHLHFEVRMLGVPQNPARFLQRNEAFARFERH